MENIKTVDFIKELHKMYRKKLVNVVPCIYISKNKIVIELCFRQNQENLSVTFETNIKEVTSENKRGLLFLIYDKTIEMMKNALISHYVRGN